MRFKQLIRRTAAAVVSMSVSLAFAQALEKPDLTIAVGPDWGTGGQAVVALNKGFFAAQGFKNVQLKVFPAGLMQVEALASGAVDLANPAQSPVIAMRTNGVPVVVLSSLATYGDSIAVVMRKSAGIKEAKQLEGMKIGTLKGTSSEQMIIALAKHYKLDLSKIQMVNLAPPEQLSSLATGAIDGIAVWQPWVSLAATKIPVDVVHTGSHSRFASNNGAKVKIDNTRGVLISSEKFAKDNPATIDALMRVYAKAQAYMTDPATNADAMATFSKHFNQDVQANNSILPAYSLSLALDDAYLEDMESVQGFLASSGRIKSKLPIASFTRGAALGKVSPAMVGSQFK